MGTDGESPKGYRGQAPDLSQILDARALTALSGSERVGPYVVPGDDGRIPQPPFAALFRMARHSE
jgi:hypothetical protein